MTNTYMITFPEGDRMTLRTTAGDLACQFGFEPEQMEELEEFGSISIIGLRVDTL